METGILYALTAGFFWGTSPVLVKRGLAHASVSAATLCQQATILLTFFCAALAAGHLCAGKFPLPAKGLVCFVAAGFLYAIGSIFTLKGLAHAPASVVAPIWSAQPIVSFLLAKTTLQGIEEVTLRDGTAAALVVAGVLVLRWG